MSGLLTPTEPRPPFFRTVSATSQRSTRSSTSLALTRTFSHRKDKLRLYLALFSRGGPSGGSYGSRSSCESYHWALIIGPKSPLRSEAGIAYHIVHNSNTDFVSTPYYYEETDLRDNPHQSRNVLARIALAKIMDEQRLVQILRTLAPDVTSEPTAKGLSRTWTSSPSQTSLDSGDDFHPSMSCLSWVQSAWENISGDPQRPLKSYFGPKDWESIESRARKYIKRKRNQGRYQANIDPADITWNPDEICTWNYWENRETTD